MSTTHSTDTKYGWKNPKTQNWVDWNLRKLSKDELMTDKQKGVEVEFFVLHPDLSPVDESVSNALLAAMNEVCPDSTAFEANACQREFHSKPYSTTQGVMDELWNYFSQLNRYASGQGLTILVHSLHPTALTLAGSDAPFVRLITDQKHGLLATELAANCSVQQNLEVIDPNALLYCHRQWRRILPILAALSAASPFWGGKPTGSMSSASYLRRIRHDGGIPFRYDPELSFEQHVKREIAFTQIGPVYSHPFLAHNNHLRLRVDRGCIEVSITDVPLELGDIQALLELCSGLNTLFIMRYLGVAARIRFLGPEEGMAILKGLGEAWLRGMQASLYVDTPTGCDVRSASKVVRLMVADLTSVNLLTAKAASYVETRLQRGSDAEYLLAQMSNVFDPQRFAEFTVLNDRRLGNGGSF